MRSAAAVILVLSLRAAAAPTPPLAPDIPAQLKPSDLANFEKRDVMIPMRDGVKLHTVILVPKGAKHAPILLTRTPYNASKRAGHGDLELASSTGPSDDVFSNGDYIRVYQDVRGKYGSEGDYVMTRPLRGPLNDSTVDHSTDAYDTIDWLVKNVKESNGKVGMIGSSYEGFTVLMALVHPHPALVAAVPECPMVDGWKGDDWFHNGAFRNTNLDYFYGQTGQKGEGEGVPRGAYDDFETFLRAGSTGAFAQAHGFDQLPYWHKLAEHPAYDAYWQGQALDQILAKEPLKVPTLLVGSQWDQEDSYGAVHTYAALEPKDKANDKVFLVLGPWRHSQANADGATLGPLKFDSDTALAFRRDILKPFLDARLIGTRTTTSPVTVYETGTNTWRHVAKWPLGTAKPLYLHGDGSASFAPPTAVTAQGFTEYTSDPAKPVPNVVRPVNFLDHDQWKNWLLADQRAVVDRPDVISFVTEPLATPVHIAGPTQVSLYASTSGTDSDWIVKLIDVYPDQDPAEPAMGGYELGIAMDIFRGRYRTGFDKPTAIPANQIEHYAFALPHADHVFGKGHRIMVQVQSTWFPYYDRNPQTFVDNIFFAKPSDYKKATQRVYHEPKAASAVELPIAP
ncbi:MAG TPA: CocE/NonD family hydrolase [Kofleriaceae bacterium]|nr:CocE/NonD family hydrolase [Kofleriaceae bacterium]